MKKIWTYVLASLFLISSVAWAKDYKMVATSIVPGATGKVSVDEDKDSGNRQVKVEVEHLAKPTLLTPPGSAYVVWIQPQGEKAQNSGMLTVNNDLKAKVEMTTTAKQFTVLVTAETEPRPEAPSERVVLRTDVK